MSEEHREPVARRAGEWSKITAWWTPRCRACDGWLTFVEAGDSWFCESCNAPRYMGTPAVEAPRTPSDNPRKRESP